MKRLLLLAGVTVAALLGAATAPPPGATPLRSASPAPGPTLGFSFRAGGGTLAWFDPMTMQTLPGRKAPLARHWGSWAFSADRSILATGSCDSVDLRLVNARSMRVLGDVKLGTFSSNLGGGCVDGITWVRPDRLLALASTTESRVVVVDARARRVLRRELLPGPAWERARTPTGLVVQLGSSDGFRPARLAVVDADGTIRIATVDGILAGTVFDEESEDHRVRTMHPGLAVDGEGGRAFLVPAAGPVAEIDLATLAVTYHELSRPRSLLSRLGGWLVPTAQAKEVEGPTRTARWLGDGLIAVSGTDYSVTKDASGKLRMLGRAAGLELIDTRSWAVRTLNAGASWFTVAPGLIVAEGGSTDSAQQGPAAGIGLVAYGLDGRERWRLHEGLSSYLNAVGSLGYVYPDPEALEIVDLADGRVIRTLHRDGSPWPYLLAAASSDW